MEIAFKPEIKEASITDVILAKGTTEHQGVHELVKFAALIIDQHFEIEIVQQAFKTYPDGAISQPLMLRSSTKGKMVHAANGIEVTHEEALAASPHTDEEIAASQPHSYAEMAASIPPEGDEQPREVIPLREIIPLRKIVPINMIPEREFYANIPLNVVFPELGAAGANLKLIDGIKRLVLSDCKAQIINQKITWNKLSTN